MARTRTFISYLQARFGGETRTHAYRGKRVREKLNGKYNGLRNTRERRIMTYKR